MKHFLLILLALPIIAGAEDSLEAQINRVNDVQNKIVQEREQQREAAIQLELEKQKEEKKLEEERIKQAKATEEQRLKEQKRKEAAAEDARRKREAYLDENRKMDLEERKAKLAIEQAKAKHADDYVNADLKRESAKTDVIQSQADGNRNVSEGEKELMTGMGKGAEKSGWFDRIFK